MALVYLAFTAAFNLLPRSTYSELEKRDLRHFPAFTLDSLLDGSYASAISSWYSDTEPYRDTLMYMSMQFRDMLGVRFGDSNIQYVASDTPAEAEAIPEEPDPVAEADTVKGVKAFTVDTTAGGIDDIAKVASAEEGYQCNHDDGSQSSNTGFGS